MRNDVTALLEEATDAMTACWECPLRSECVFATPEHSPGRCLHEYKLLHAFLWSRQRRLGALDVSGFAQLAREARGYAEFLRRSRPFDPSRLSNVLPAGPGVPFQEANMQANLMAFAPP